jgi:hypothetical protein
MKSVHAITVAALLLAALACKDDALKSKTPSEPLPSAQGAQAFLQVDNESAQPGERVNVFVRVQLGTEGDTKIGSYTGRLKFDPAFLSWASDLQINDGMRVVNPNGAGTGEIRFAGASATGFTDLALYHGVFQVKQAGYMDQIKLVMEEMSAAKTLGNMRAQLRVAPQVFLRTGAN